MPRHITSHITRHPPILRWAIYLICLDKIVYLCPIPTYMCHIQAIRRPAILHRVKCRVSRAENSLSEEIEAMCDMFPPFAIDHSGTHHVDLNKKHVSAQDEENAASTKLTTVKLMKHRDAKFAFYSSSLLNYQGFRQKKKRRVRTLGPQLDKAVGTGKGMHGLPSASRSRVREAEHVGILYFEGNGV